METFRTVRSGIYTIQPVSLIQEITVWNYETGCMQILGWKEINICLYASTSITPVQANFSGRVTTHIQNRVTQQTCQKLNTCITVHSVNCAVHNLQKEDKVFINNNHYNAILQKFCFY